MIVFCFISKRNVYKKTLIVSYSNMFSRYFMIVSSHFHYIPDLGRNCCYVYSDYSTEIKIFIAWLACVLKIFFYINNELFYKSIYIYKQI